MGNEASAHLVQHHEKEDEFEREALPEESCHGHVDEHFEEEMRRGNKVEHTAVAHAVAVVTNRSRQRFPQLPHLVSDLVLSQIEHKEDDRSTPLLTRNVAEREMNVITRHDPLRFTDDGQREKEIMTQPSQIVQQIHLARGEHRDVQGFVGSSERMKEQQPQGELGCGPGDRRSPMFPGQTAQFQHGSRFGLEESARNALHEEQPECDAHDREDVEVREPFFRNVEPPRESFGVRFLFMEFPIEEDAPDDLAAGKLIGDAHEQDE